MTAPPRPPCTLVAAAGGAIAAAAMAALGGCLSVPEGVAPMCHSNNDCDRSHGEVCEEGVCWGNPPPGPYAAVVSPPSSRQDLVAREIPQLVIPDIGWVGDLTLEPPVLLSGKLVAFCPPPPVACDPTPLAGTVTVSRPPQFRGGPGFKATTNVAAGASFAMPVRRTQMGDDPYTVTIVPDATRQVTGRSAAEIVPPRRMQVSVSDNLAIQAIQLGGAALPTISGTLRDSAGAGLASYRVSAFGHWDPTEPAVEVSTVDYTDASGAYSVTLSDRLTGTVELVARPVPATSTGAPPTAAAIHAGGLDATAASTRDIVVPNNLGKPTTLSLQIQGLDDQSGMIVPVSAALVSLTGTVTDSLTSFTVSDAEVADASGQVTLRLLDGSGLAASYRLSVTPPAGSGPGGAGSSLGGVIFDQKLSSFPMLPLVRLTPRLALRGKLFYGGQPLANATITARPSLRFLWALDAAAQVFVASIPPATFTTPANGGDFVLKVDPNVAQVWGYYDLVIEPAAGTRAPSFVVSEFAIPRNPALDPVTVTFNPPEPTALPGIYLSDAAFIHGRVAGPDGKSVEGAEVKVYEVSTQLTLCSEVAHAPASCPIPAALQARNTSDAEGTVRLALPR
jgi:hypothetical protein